MKRLVLTSIMCLVFMTSVTIVPQSSYAGQSCEAHKVQVDELRSAILVAEHVRSALNKSNTTYALIARQGSDVTEHGMKYTHLGIAQKRPNLSLSEEGEWTVIHQLNHCGSAQSGLFRHGLANFMLDDLYTHDVIYAPISPQLSESLAHVFERKGPLQIYEPKYNMISNPRLPARYQNSNQWVLEILAQAQAHSVGARINSRKKAHQYYLSQGYHGTDIHVPGWRRSMASVFSKNVRFDDHPASSRERQRYEVVSVKSVISYLKTSGNLMSVAEIEGVYQRKGK